MRQSGMQLANLANGFGENSGAANVVIVTIHAGHDGMFQAQRSHCLSHAARFIPIDRFGPSLGHGAESATASADIAQQHEGRGLVIPALADVGTLRRFANRMQAQAARQLFELVEIVANRSFGAQPVRLGHAERRAQGRSGSVEKYRPSVRFYQFSFLRRTTRTGDMSGACRCRWRDALSTAGGTPALLSFSPPLHPTSTSP